MLCQKLSPDVLEGKIFFRKPELDSGNKFVRITDSHVVVSSRTFDLPEAQVNGTFLGAQREIHEIMLYRPDWMQRNYHQPLAHVRKCLASISNTNSVFLPD